MKKRLSFQRKGRTLSKVLLAAGFLQASFPYAWCAAPVIEIPCRKQSSTQSQRAESALTACSGAENAVQKALYGETPSQKNGGIFQNLVNHMRHLYLGKPTYTKDASTGKLVSNNDPTGKIPICSLKRGEIQKEMIRQDTGSLPTSTLEEESNYLGQRCGDNFEISITSGIDCGATEDFPFFSCTLEATGKLVSDTASPLTATSSTKLRGSWEITHLRSIYLMAIEEAWLEVKKELTDNNGKLVPQTAAGLVGATDQQNVLNRLRTLATETAAESENMVEKTKSNQATTIDDQDLFEKQMSHCLQTEVTFEAQADGTIKKKIASSSLKLGETTDATTGAKSIDTGSLRQRSEHLCVAWKANQLAVNELIFSEIILRAGKKARDTKLANLGDTFFKEVMTPRELRQDCIAAGERAAKSHWRNAKNAAQSAANSCIKTKIRENLKKEAEKAFPLLYTTAHWRPTAETLRIRIDFNSIHEVTS